MGAGTSSRYGAMRAGRGNSRGSGMRNKPPRYSNNTTATVSVAGVTQRQASQVSITIQLYWGKLCNMIFLWYRTMPAAAKPSPRAPWLSLACQWARASPTLLFLASRKLNSRKIPTLTSSGRRLMGFCRKIPPTRETVLSLQPHSLCRRVGPSLSIRVCGMQKPWEIWAPVSAC
jgi:hypothetical protein